MEDRIKLKLSFYGLVSAISYVYLIMQPRPAISVPIFIILQFVTILYVIKGRREVKNSKALFLFIPIFILSMNYFVSANNMFQTMNYMLTIILYSTVILLFTDRTLFLKNNCEYLFKIIINIFIPLFNLHLPFKWILEKNEKNPEKLLKIGQIIKGLLLSIPFVIFLLLMLSSADLIFSHNIESVADFFINLINFNILFKTITGVFVGLYLIGLLCIVFKQDDIKNGIDVIPNSEKVTTECKRVADILSMDILLGSVLIIYTIFVLIQFKYLFANSSLPYGLTYSEYARRGFFELLLLTMFNVLLILSTIFIFKEKIYVQNDKGSIITKIFLVYLCLLTAMLLISSFYRMYLYNNQYGFTRLRIMVDLFLIFEALGLGFILGYIIKPNFNVVSVCIGLGLIYYLVLNTMQIDYIVAKRNIDMYFSGDSKDIDVDYLMDLSLDAAPQIIRLADNDEVDFITSYKAKIYIENLKEPVLYKEVWQNYNLSVSKSKKLSIKTE